MRKKRILIIDDEKNFTNVLKLWFENTGDFIVLEENNALNGLTAARHFQPDLIVLDINMPDMSGGELASEIKEDPALQDIPVIFLTGLINKREERRIRGSFYVSKPVRVNYLLDCINTILQQSTGSAKRTPYAAKRSVWTRRYAYN
jgi:CheY-like chemotaxis protein